MIEVALLLLAWNQALLHCLPYVYGRCDYDNHKWGMMEDLAHPHALLLYLSFYSSTDALTQSNAAALREFLWSILSHCYCFASRWHITRPGLFIIEHSLHVMFALLLIL